MKLEVGMYVRTDDGYIAKYDKSKHNCSGKYYGFASTIRDLRWEEYDDDCFLWESELKSIVKASYNIIDILEVGDVIIDKEGHKYPINYEFETDYNGEYNSYEIIIDDHITLFLKDGLSIVTHEQMEQMAYKVGDK